MFSLSHFSRSSENLVRKETENGRRTIASKTRLRQLACDGGAAGRGGGEPQCHNGRDDQNATIIHSLMTDALLFFFPPQSLLSQ
jgi:hypothetical protein